MKARIRFNWKYLLLGAAVLATTAHGLIDSDDDGMSDIWEQEYGFAISGTQPSHQLPDADLDEDGWTNFEESQAGTNPNLASGPEGILKPSIRRHPEFPSVYLLSWPSLEGKQYSLQGSPDLSEGSWIEVDEPTMGTGEDIEYGLEPLDENEDPLEKYFWRVSVGDVDTDGDTLSDHEEISLGTNPQLADSDGDALPDAWEIAHGSDPGVDDAALPFQGGPLTNGEAFEAGVQAQPDASIADFDGDGLENEVDAAPLDRIIDWRTTPRPNFVMIDLQVEDVDDLFLNDFTENGSVLLTRVEGSMVVERVVVDVNQMAHTYHFGDNPTLEGEFSGYSSVLIGDKVPGTRLVNGLSEDVIWDPVDNSFADWSCPTAYQDSICDERGGLLFGTGWMDHFDHLRYSVDASNEGHLLPGDDEFSIVARIEGNGNTLTDRGYWRRDSQVGTFEKAWSADGQAGSFHRSATIDQGAGESVDTWNIVAGTAGALIAKGNGDFKRPQTYDLAYGEIIGATRQGWVFSSDGRVWANGWWSQLEDCIGGVEDEDVTILDILDTGMALGRMGQGSNAKLILLVPVEVVELSPQVTDEDGNPIEGSEFPSAGSLLTPFVEEEPALNKIAHRELKVRVGKALKGKMVTWTMDPLFIPSYDPGGPNPPPSFRGSWEYAAETHRNFFEPSAAYGSNAFASVSNVSGRTTIDEDGFTAVRINIPPIGFNQARVFVQIEGAVEEVDLIDMEVPGVIVIDPGHGGVDSGSVGRTDNSVLEKDLALAYAKKLREELMSKFELERRNLRVVMTRMTTDEFLEKADRPALARDHGADVFVSIHFNAASTHSAHGTETFIERTYAERGPGDDGDNKNLDEDNDLASALQSTTLNAITAAGGTAIDRGVKRAGFTVILDGANSNGNTEDYHPIKACLVEVEFLTNEGSLETIKLTNPSGPVIRDAFAEDGANDIFSTINDQQ